MKADSLYAPLEQQYITSDITFRSLAEQAGKSFSAIAAWGRKHQWAEKREAYRESVRTKSLLRAADNEATLAATIRNEAVSAMRATVYEYVDQLKAKKVHVGTKEAATAIEKLMLLIGDPTERTETTVLGDGDAQTIEDIREVVRLARAHVVSSSVEERP